MATPKSIPSCSGFCDQKTDQNWPASVSNNGTFGTRLESLWLSSPLLPGMVRTLRGPPFGHHVLPKTVGGWHEFHLALY